MEDAPPPKPKEITIHTAYDQNYKLLPTNGAWVGTTTRQDVTVDFFVEQLATPEAVTYELEDNGRFEKELARTPEGRRFVRIFQVGVIMTPATAEAVANIILKRVEAMKKAVEKT